MKKGMITGYLCTERCCHQGAHFIPVTSRPIYYVLRRLVMSLTIKSGQDFASLEAPASLILCLPPLFQFGETHVYLICEESSPCEMLS